MVIETARAEAESRSSEVGSFAAACTGRLPRAAAAAATAEGLFICCGITAPVIGSVRLLDGNEDEPVEVSDMEDPEEENIGKDLSKR